MADEKEKSSTQPFPGSPTGNRSGVGDSSPEATQKAGKEKPQAPFPGSPTGNASGAGDEKP